MWVQVDAELRMGLRCGGLSADAFTLYMSSIGYAARWGIEEVSIGVCRFALGRMARKAVRELVDAGLWVPVGERRYLVAGKGELWKTCPAPARPRKAIPHWLRVAVYARDGFRCVRCESVESLSLDHIHPHSLGGSDTIDNLQTLCRSCNSRKGARA